MPFLIGLGVAAAILAPFIIMSGIFWILYGINAFFSRGKNGR